MDEARVAFAPIGDQRALLVDGGLTVPQLVSMYLKRIQQFDKQLNAFVSVRANTALEDAKRCQQLLDEGDQRPLLGIPFAVKDEHDLAGEVTAWGTDAVRTPAKCDDEIVGALRSAGAIPIGKTTMPELGLHPFTESPTRGVTRNPWDPSRSPGGSSGGSAAVVAAGLASFATAADGGGSIRIPASCCNLFGLKVQRGRLDTPDVSVAGGMGVPGVLTRRVADAALLYDLLWASGPPRDGPIPPWTRSLSSVAETAAPGRLRIGVTFGLGLPAPVTAEVRTLITALARRLSALGHDVVDARIEPGRWDIPFALLGMRFAAVEAGRLDRPDRLDRRTKSIVRGGSLVIPPVLRWALRRQDALTAKVSQVFDGLDLVLTPTLADAPVEAGRWQGRGVLRTSWGVARWCPFTSLANLVGNPAASVPAGFTESGLPVGADLLARRGAESTLVAVAAQLERELRWHETRPKLDSAIPGTI